MQLIFIRHGHYDKKLHKTRAERDRAPLSAEGEADARRAGTYLGEHAIRPDFVLHTATERTRQTAALVLEELGVTGRPTINVGTTFRNFDGLARKLARWSAQHGIPDESVVFLVGHGSTQDALRKCFTGDALPPTADESHGAWLELFVGPGQAPRAGGFFVGRLKNEVTA